MITTKGIVEGVEFNRETKIYQYRVRIPMFHEIEGASTIVTKDLPLALYPLPPHMENTTLRVGDVVYCSLEDGMLDNVVILGLIPSSSINNTSGSRETESKISVENISSASFNEKGSAILPYNIKIRTDDSTKELIDGEGRNYINGQDLAYLRGLDAPVVQKLQDLQDAINYLETNLLHLEVRPTVVYSKGKRS